MATQYIIQKDTAAWSIQTWLSFFLSLACCFVGVWNLPSAELDRAFLAIGFIFCLFSSFAVAKTTRDNRDGQVDTQLWVMTVWIAFSAAIALTAWGLFRMKAEYWHKAFLVSGWLYLVSSTFVLAKLIRDKHEATLMERGANAN